MKKQLKQQSKELKVFLIEDLTHEVEIYYAEIDGVSELFAWVYLNANSLQKEYLFAVSANTRVNKIISNEFKLSFIH